MILAAAAIMMLTAQAQIKPIPVNYAGQRPTIVDFVQAIVDQDNDEDDYNEHLANLHTEWHRLQKGEKTYGSFTIDAQNGFVVYERTDDNYKSTTQFCYWNCADKKHKLVAVADNDYEDDMSINGQFSGLVFYLYDNLTRRLNFVNTYDMGIDISEFPGDREFTLPRQGKDIRLRVIHPEDGTHEVLFKWNGEKFKEQR